MGVHERRHLVGVHESTMVVHRAPHGSPQKRHGSAMGLRESTRTRYEYGGPHEGISIIENNHHGSLRKHQGSTTSP